MSTYEVFVDGSPVVFVDPSTVFEWQIRGGVGAFVQQWEVPTDLANQIVRDKAGKEIKLKLHKTEIERVIVLGNAPTRNVHTQYLVFTDVRWYWTRQWLVRDFNLRRRTGDRRSVGNAPPQAVQIVPDITYAPWSINDGAAWQWGAATKSVMDEAVAGKLSRPSIEWTYDPSKFAITDRIVEETYIDDGLPVAIAKALASIPGRDLYVDIKGKVHIYDRIPGAEKDFVKFVLPPALEGHSDFKFIDCKASRSKKYYVLHDPEAEVRIDCGGPTTDKEIPWAENVLRTPDVTTTIPASGTKAQRDVGQGTIVTHTEAYDAWGAGTNAIPCPELTDDIVRNHWIAGDLVWKYSFRSDGTMDPVWASRIEEVQTTYRTLFRVNPRFWQRVRAAKAKMHSIWDTETGTWADSPVYCDHAIMPIARAPAARAAMSSNQTSYAALIVNGQKAPARVRIIDEDQGLFFIEWRKDTTGKYAEITPAAVTSPATLDMTAGTLEAQGWSTRRLVASTEWRLSTILTLVPAAPNDSRRLHSVEVTIEDAAARLGISAAGLGSLEATGPDKEVRSRLTTARFPWSDDDQLKNQTYELFGAFTPQPPNPANPPPPILTPVNVAELKAVSEATAAYELLNFLDHVEGVRTVPEIAEGIIPLGTINMVAHQVGENFCQTTMVAVAPNIPPDPMAILPASVRKILAREVVP